jgi:hypothetical protein
MDVVEVLGSRILLHPSELERSHRFYRDQLGLAVYREFGSREAPGLVFFLGNGLLEVSGRSTDRPGNAVAIWIQVVTCRANIGGCLTRVCRYSASRGKRRGADGDVDRGSGRSAHRPGRGPR